MNENTKHCRNCEINTIEKQTKGIDNFQLLNTNSVIRHFFHLYFFIFCEAPKFSKKSFRVVSQITFNQYLFCFNTFGFQIFNSPLFRPLLQNALPSSQKILLIILISVYLGLPSAGIVTSSAGTFNTKWRNNIRSRCISVFQNNINL